MINNKKNILILGGNSTKNIEWIKKMELLYLKDYNVNIIKYDNWYNENRINIENELEKIKNISLSKKIDIIIAKSIGMLLTVKAVNLNYINPKVIIFMGYPLKFFNEEKIDIINDILELRNKSKMFFIQQNNDPQCSGSQIDKIINGKIPLIIIEGNDHQYNQLKIIKKYIDNFIELNYEFDFREISGSNIDEVVKKIVKRPKKYKYINNWILNSNNKILAFKYKNISYIAKKTNKKNGIIEIENAKKLKRIFSLNNNNYIINVPIFCEINNNTGYLVTKYYGKDLNQYYYDNIDCNKYDYIFNDVTNVLSNNNIRYNGFLPRNIIVDNDKIFFIDFEDVNNKTDIAIETNLKIAWSYFCKEKFDMLNSKLLYNDSFSNFFKRNKLLDYSNPYLVALNAEKKYDDRFKMDDIINVLSNYVSKKVEILLDVILYEINKNREQLEVREQLYTLTQEIRILDGIYLKRDLKEYANKRVYNILEKVSNEYNNNLKIILTSVCKKL